MIVPREVGTLDDTHKIQSAEPPMDKGGDDQQVTADWLQSANKTSSCSYFKVLIDALVFIQLTFIEQLHI